MAVVTSDFLGALFTSYRVLWEDAFLAAQSAVQYQRYCTIVPSDTDTESYNWLGSVPRMREWLDERALQGLGSYTYSLRNRHFESTIEVDRNTMEDDKYGLIRPRIVQLAQEAARFPSELAVTALVAGSSTAGYDGVNYFSASHTEESSGTQSNTNVGTGTTLAQVRADFIAARTAMRRTKDGAGRPMNLQPDLVIIPPDLEDVFEQLMHTNMIALSSGSQQSNVLLNAADILVDALLTDTNDWYLLNTSQAMKPLIFQWRKQPEFVALDNPRDQEAFMRRKFFYGVDERCAAGFGLWQLAQKITN